MRGVRHKAGAAMLLISVAIVTLGSALGAPAQAYAAGGQQALASAASEPQHG